MTTADAESPEPGDTGAPPRPIVRYTFTPSDATAWIRPGFAVIVVCVVAVLILGILITAVVQLHVTTVPGVGGAAGTVAADPNAGTVAALAGAALSAITSLAAAYFGIKVASEQTAQASAQASSATAHALTVLGNSTSNGNPRPQDV